MLTNSLYEKIEQLEKDLEQQRFNNKHNLSIDQKVSDEIARLKSENAKLKINKYAHENCKNQLDEANKLIEFLIIAMAMEDSDE